MLCLCCLPIAVSELAASSWALKSSLWTTTLVILTGPFPQQAILLSLGKSCQVCNIFFVPLCDV